MLLIHPSHSSWTYHPSNSRWKVQITKPFIMHFSDPSVSFSLLGADILLSTPFSHALNQCFPLMLVVTRNEHIRQNYSWVYFNLDVFFIAAVYIDHFELHGSKDYLRTVLYKTAHVSEQGCMTQSNKGSKGPVNSLEIQMSLPNFIYNLLLTEVLKGEEPG
jgi:hypothetical protein